MNATVTTIIMKKQQKIKTFVVSCGGLRFH